MQNFKKLRKIILISALSAAVFGCVKTVETIGYANEDAKFDKLVIGETRKAVVERELGSPSSVSTYGPETWYYIATEHESIAFLKPKVKSQTVVSIEFNDDETIKTINKFTEKDARQIKLSKDKTPTEGHDAGLIGQMLGNVGRFNKEHKDSSVRP